MYRRKTATAALALLLAAGSLGLADKAAAPDAKPGEKEKKKDKKVVTSKAEKHRSAATINFKKAYGLPFPSLGTLGSRIESARRSPDPVALAHAAGELAVAEKVSGKKADLTSKALLAESAELARMRREVAELKAVAAIHQQVSYEAGQEEFWNKMIRQTERDTKRELDNVRNNTLPTGAPRKVLINNYTSQYLDLWVNGYYKMQIPPGGSKWCVIEHKWDPTILKVYGNEDSGVWGPRYIYGDHPTYTWNIEG
jgi:hypothetical protein